MNATVHAINFDLASSQLNLLNAPHLQFTDVRVEILILDTEWILFIVKSKINRNYKCELCNSVFI